MTDKVVMSALIFTLFLMIGFFIWGEWIQWRECRDVYGLSQAQCYRLSRDWHEPGYGLLIKAAQAGNW